MRDAWLHDQHLSCARLDGVRADGELGLALQDDEDLLVGMPVEPRTVPRLDVDEDEADVGAAEQVALEL